VLISDDHHLEDTRVVSGSFSCKLCLCGETQKVFLKTQKIKEIFLA